MFQRPEQALRDFIFENRATISVETVLVFPMLAWWYIGAYVFFDAYRSYAYSIRAAYTVSDIISRSRDVLPTGFVNGLDGLHDRMVLTSGNPAVRVSGVLFDQRPREEYQLLWTYQTGDIPEMTQARLDDMAAEWLPLMADQEMVVMLESVVPYTPPYDLGVDLASFWRTADFNPGNWYNVVVSRPRFVQRLLLENTIDPGDGGVVSEDPQPDPDDGGGLSN